MPRLAAAVAAAMIFPGIALAQEAPEEPAQAPDSVHTVERGESLWWLARHYYDNPYDWRRIFEANQERIDDPHWIYPGQHFVVPGFTGGVTGVEVGPGGEAASGFYPGLGDPTVFSRPPRQNTPTPDERTDFYPRPQVQQSRGGVLGADRVEHMAVPRDIFYSAEWVRPAEEGLDFPGQITDWAGTDGDVEGRETIMPLDRVRVGWSEESFPRQGDLLQSLRVVRRDNALGHVVRPTGVFRVIQRTDSGVVAVSLNEYARVQMGDYVMRAPGFPLEAGQYAESVDGGPTARIVGFAQSRPIQQPGDVAFLDVGTADGVAVGDVFAIHVSQGGGWSGSVAGTLQVVRVFEDRSSARIRRVVTPVFRTGVEARMAEKMR